MGTSLDFAEDQLKLFFQAVGIPDLADNDQTGPTTTITIALHTADPGAGGDMSTNEISYGGYLRVTTARTAGGFAVTANVLTPVTTINFAEATSGSATATHCSFGTGTGDNLMYSGTITPNIVITTGVQPALRGDTSPPATTITIT